MHWFTTVLVLMPILGLLAGGVVPKSWANRHPSSMGVATMTLSIVTCLVSFGLLAMVFKTGPIDEAVFQIDFPLTLSFGIYFDSLSGVMLALVSFIGAIITQYSLRYLDGEATQGRFLRWVSFTLGAVMILIVSRNLVMFTVAWMLTSYGLHQLLTHYSERPQAIQAAMKKFWISRLGDIFLMTALVLTYVAFGSFEYREVFAQALALRGSAQPDLYISLIGTFFVVGAMTKSAQFPFHSWLPETMETPTPVSALMHAGIINAGGFLVIRLSPLISLSHVALDVLSLVGAITAIFGALVMLTQTSIKRSLAFSTIAQMGLMMLQCGLGAFSAALLHIVAHSLYKAYAFLSSASVIESPFSSRVNTIATSRVRSLIALGSATLVASCFTGATSFIIGQSLAHKSGSTVLGLILFLSLTHLLWNAFAVWNSWSLLSGILTVSKVSLGYMLAYIAMDRLLATSISHLVIVSSWFDMLLLAVVAAGFVSVFALQVAIVHGVRKPLLNAIYVHSSNGFYIDLWAHRLTAKLSGHA